LWWLAILVPLLGLLGLMAMLAQRKSRAADSGIVTHRASDRDFFANDSDDAHWPGSRTTSESRFGAETDRDFGLWSPRPTEDAIGEYDADEDAIDTAPTRIPTESDFAESESDVDEWAEAPELAAGRHAASALGESVAAWRLELDEFAVPPRRRHAVDDPWTEEIDAVVEERVEQFDYEPGTRFDYEAASDYPQPDREELAEEPWRPAIHLPLADPFQAPAGYSIKGNTHAGLYYTPDSVLYESTIPEVWFASEELAQANGFVRAPE
jgi:hypothetical protein